jgi:hypothetical protein
MIHCYKQQWIKDFGRDGLKKTALQFFRKAIGSHGILKKVAIDKDGSNKTQL